MSTDAAMTLDLDAIRGRCDAATSGEWTRGPKHRVVTPRGTVAECPTPQNGGTFDCAANCDFILHAYQDIPALLSAVDGLVKALEPFAKAAGRAEVCDARDAGLVNEYAGLTVGDLRAAAAQLAAIVRKPESRCRMSPDGYHSPFPDPRPIIPTSLIRKCRHCGEKMQSSSAALARKGEQP